MSASTKAAPPAAHTSAAVTEAQTHLDALEHELRWAIPKRESEIHQEQAEAKRRGDAATVERLQEEKFELARRNNTILQHEKAAATNALLDARRAQVTASMALPTGSVEDLERTLDAERRTLRLLAEEQQQIEGKIGAALRAGDAKAGPSLMARKAAIPFEMAAADVRVRRAQAALLVAQIADAEADLPRLNEAVEATEQPLADATAAHNQAVGERRLRLSEKREAEGALRQLRRRFAADLEAGA